MPPPISGCGGIQGKGTHEVQAFAMVTVVVMQLEAETVTVAVVAFVNGISEVEAEWRWGRASTRTQLASAVRFW